MAGKAGAVRAGRAYVEVFADHSPLVRGLKTAEFHMRAFGKKLRALGSSMTTAGILGVTPVAFAMKWFMEFDDAMLAVKASTSASGKEFESLTAKARELGRSTSYTSAEVAKAMLELGRAGFDSAGIDASIAGMLDLARATGTELPLATEIAAATLQGFALEASDMTRVADVLVATANGSAVSLEDLGESMKYVAPIASEAGMSLEDTAKALGTLANMGIKGSMAGTSLRQILLRLSQTKVQDKLRAMGVESLDASGNLRKMGDIMIDLGVAMAGMPNAQRLSLMKDLFDQRAVTGAVKLSSVQFERLNALIDNSSGLARRQAAEMDAGFGGAWREMTGAIEDVALAVGTALEPTLIRLAQYLRDSVNAISAFIAENEGLVLGFTAVSASLLILGPLVSGIGMAMMAGATAVGILGTACTLLVAGASSPVMLVVAGFTLMAREGSPMFDLLTASADTMRSHFAALGSTVTEVFGVMSDAIQAGEMEYALKALTAGIGLELLRLQDMWSSFWESLPGMGGDDKAFIKRINAIAEAENELTRIKNRLALRIEGKQLAARKADLAKTLGGSLTSTAAKIAGMDPAKILQGVGQFIRDASQAATGGITSAAAKIAGTNITGIDPTWIADMDPTRILQGGGKLIGGASQLENLDELLGLIPAKQQGAAGGAAATGAAAGGTLPGWLTSIAGMDPAKILQGVGQFIGEASQALPDFLANAAMNLTDDIAPEAGLVSQITRSARGTFSSLAAGRMGAVGSTTNRTERQLEKLVQKQDHANRRLDQFVDLASKAKLVFTGALPG